MDREQIEANLVVLLAAERPRLLRLCTYLTGDSEIADDLVQETAIEAWRNSDKVYDWDGAAAWLSAIARNVCLRWARQRGRQLSRFTSLMVETAADDFDIDVEIELERDELAQLLDQAMALLPPETQAVLVERFITGSPHAETAARLGLSEAAVAVRLHRGKVALRRLLESDFREQAVTYGLVVPAADEWQETRIWCPFCGQRKLRGRLNRETGYACFQCPACELGAPVLQITSTDFPTLIADVKSYKSILSRQIAWLNDYYRQAMAGQLVQCPQCHAVAETPVQVGLGTIGRSEPHLRHGIRMYCTACDEHGGNPLTHLVLDLPETQRFWKQHPRMRILPEQEVEVNGRSAYLSAFESVTHAARLDILSDAETLAVLGIHETSNN